MNTTINRNFLRRFLCLIFCIGFALISSAQSTSWIGGTNNKWTTASNWTNGVPNSSTNAIIGDASFTGPNQPRANSGTLRCNDLTIGNGAVSCSLTIAKNVVVYGDVIIGSNGTIYHNSNKKITVQGDWTNNGNYSATNNGAKVYFSGSTATLNGTTTFRDLRITATCSLTLAADITVNSDMDVYGVLNPTASYSVSGTADLDVERDGSIMVESALFATNYPISQVDINDRGEVNYSSASITQTVSDAHTYGILRISGGSTKELAADLPDMHNGGAPRGRVVIDAGVFDLKSFTCNRQLNGGDFVIAADAELWIGGTNGFPNNFATVSLASSSTVKYYGGNQTVRDLDYGHLILTGTSGVVVKTMPSTTLDILGDFSIEEGLATSVSATAGNSVNVEQNVTIESNCTFDGASYTHQFNADFDNEGTLTGSTSTIQFTGVGALIAGAGNFNFNNIEFTQSGIRGDAGTVFIVSGDATTTGAGEFTHGSGSTFEMDGSSTSISGSNFGFFDLDISGTVTTAENINIGGDLLVDGTFTATNGIVIMTGASSAIGGTGSLTFFGLESRGNTTTDMDFNVDEDFSVEITASFIASAGDITFDGTSDFTGTATFYDISISGGSSLQMGSNSRMNIENSLNNTGTFNTNALIANTVAYVKNGAQTVAAETYYNLILATGGTKTLAGATTVNNDITINSGVTLDGSSYVLSIYRHWNNNGIYTASTSDVQFRGSNAAIITGATTFNTFTVNKTASDVQVLLDNDVSATAIVMTQGFVDTDINKITTTSTRTGNGIILGTIVHSHTIANATTYYFEGPNNGLTFYNPGSLSLVSVKVTPGEVPNVDPLEESVTREYDISIPSGTYDSVTLRLHYEDNELNAFVEPFLAIYRHNSGTTWDSLGVDSRDVAANYVELGGITNIDDQFMMAGLRNEVRWTGTVSSDWSNAGNWTTVSGQSLSNRVPDSLDVARIGDTLFVNQPEISTEEKINVLRFADTKAATITFNGGSLDIVGSGRGNWSSNVSHVINVGDDTLTIGTDLKLSDGVSAHDIELQINTGQVNILNDLEHSATGSITFSGAGDLRVNGDYNYTSGAFTPSTGTVTYSGSINQTVADLAYYNLDIDKNTARARLVSPTTVSNNMRTLTGGELAILDTLDIEGDFSIGASTEVLEFGAPIYLAGDWTTTGSYLATAGTVFFDGTANQTVNATTFNNLCVDKASNTLSLSGNISMNNNLTLSNGTLDVETFTANRSSFGGTLSIDSAAQLRVGGANNFPDNYVTVSIDTHSTVNYDGSVSQTILPVDYGNLILDNGTPNEKTLAEGINILGDFTINSLAEFSPDTATITLYGDLTSTGTVNPGASTFILNGASKSITGSINFNNLSVVYGSYTVVSGTTDMDGDLFVETTGSLNFGSNTAILDGDLTNSGILTSNGTATFTGTQVQNISLLNAINSSSSGIINFNGTVSPVISSTSSPSFATVNINNTAGITPSVPWTVIVALNVDASAAFNAGALDHTIYGNFDNDGTVTSSGKLIFQPGAPYSASATIQMDGISFSSTGEVVFAGTAPITLSSSNPTLAHVSISNTHSSGVTAPASWTLNGNLQINSSATFNAGTSTTHTIVGNLINNGTLNGGSSTIIFDGDTVSLDGAGSNNFEDIEVGDTTFLTLGNDILVYSDFVNDGEFDADGSTVEFTGTAAGSISGTTGSVTIDNLKTTKTSGAATTLSIPVTVTDELILVSGIFNTDATNKLIINNDALSDPGNDTSFVDGPMTKIGDDAFVFPLGDGSVWARLGISAPSATTDEFTAQYFDNFYSDTSTMAGVPTPVLNNVSRVEYWTCDRDAGSSNVDVTLHWENKNRSGIQGTGSDLVVARWNGSAWENAGQSAVSGAFTGSLTSSTVSSFSPFTFGSTSNTINALPVELLSFEAELNTNKEVDLSWQTASETNNDYFTIERSINGLDFEEIGIVDGAGNSTSLLAYASIDPRPMIGFNYYRLKQTDYDGSFSYSDVRVVNVDDVFDGLSVYPNPSKGALWVQSNMNNASIKLSDIMGAVLVEEQMHNGIHHMDISDVPAGMYILQVEIEGEYKSYRIIKQ